MTKPTSHPGKALMAHDRHFRSRACDEPVRYLGMYSRPTCSIGRYGTGLCRVEGSELLTKRSPIFARQRVRDDHGLSACFTCRLQATAERT